MKAIILAAGRGSRLKNLTEKRPKGLNMVGGKPILEWSIAALRAGGVNDIVIVAGYRAEMLQFPGVRTVLNPEWEQTNMVYSLLCARHEFKTPIIVSYSDIIYSPAAVAQLCAEEHDYTVMYDPHWQDLWRDRFADPSFDAESFSIDKDGRILDIGRSGCNVEEIQGQYMGLMRFSAKAFGDIVEFVAGNDITTMDMTTLLRKLIKAGYPVYGSELQDRWIEIDSPDDLKLAAEYFENNLICLN